MESKEVRSKAKVVTIVRKRWARGEREAGKPQTALLNDDGMQCCLGFVCRALGASESDILGVGVPSAVHEIRASTRFVPPVGWTDWVSPAWLATIEYKAITINDDRRIGDEAREKQLREIFADSPIRLRFVP